MDHERGITLLEALISATMMLLVVAAIVPFLLSTRHLVGRLARRSAELDAARLAAVRLVHETRRAGFGLLAGPPAAVIEAGTGALTLAWLDGGFDGGHEVTAPAGAGETVLILATLGRLAAGDSVVLADRWGRAFEARLAVVEPAVTRVTLSTPLPHAVGPSDGTLLYRVVAHRWWSDASGLRRDAQPVAADLALTVGVPTAGTGPESWLRVTSAPPPGVVSGDLLVGKVGVRPAGSPEQPLELAISQRLRHRRGGGASPLP